tara:strand:- start:2383 stop:3249 length:867 start_codon:yes stop_codon:yes gene_type:complete
MKYSYFCPGKAGKYLIRDMFWHNNKTHCLMCCGEPPIYAVMSTPKGKFDWYWEDSSGRLIQASHKVHDNILLNHNYSETWFPVETKGKYCVKKLLKDSDINASRTCPGLFHKCFEHAFQADLLVNPLVMLGYGGVLGTNKLGKLLRNRTPNLENIPLDYVIDELKQRKNIITHKEDMEQLARNYFIGNGHLPYMNPDVLFTNTEEKYVHEVTKLINSNRQFEKDIADLLDYYNIPYEWFNLDTDNYSEVFELEKTFHKDEDPHHKLYENFVDKETSDKWISEYVKNYP